MKQHSTGYQALHCDQRVQMLFATRSTQERISHYLRCDCAFYHPLHLIVIFDAHFMFLVYHWFLLGLRVLGGNRSKCLAVAVAWCTPQWEQLPRWLQAQCCDGLPNVTRQISLHRRVNERSCADANTNPWAPNWRQSKAFKYTCFAGTIFCDPQSTVSSGSTTKFSHVLTSSPSHSVSRTVSQLTLTWIQLSIYSVPHRLVSPDTTHWSQEIVEACNRKSNNHGYSSSRGKKTQSYG